MSTELLSTEKLSLAQYGRSKSFAKDGNGRLGLSLTIKSQNGYPLNYAGEVFNLSEAIDIRDAINTYIFNASQTSKKLQDEKDAIRANTFQVSESSSNLLKDVKSLLDSLTDYGLLDELARHMHPDKINAVCDAVTNACEEKKRSWVDDYQSAHHGHKAGLTGDEIERQNARERETAERIAASVTRLLHTRVESTPKTFFSLPPAVTLSERDALRENKLKQLIEIRERVHANGCVHLDCSLDSDIARLQNGQDALETWY